MLEAAKQPLPLEGLEAHDKAEQLTNLLIARETEALKRYAAVVDNAPLWMDEGDLEKYRNIQNHPDFLSKGINELMLGFSPADVTLEDLQSAVVTDEAKQKIGEMIQFRDAHLHNTKLYELQSGLSDGILIYTRVYEGSKLSEKLEHGTIGDHLASASSDLRGTLRKIEQVAEIPAETQALYNQVQPVLTKVSRMAEKILSSQRQKG